MALLSTGSLLDLPPEVLDPITAYLYAPDVVRLYMTGSKLLQYRMCHLGGVRIFNLVSTAQRASPSFPPIVGLFKSLEHFGMENDDIACDCGATVRNVNLSLLPPTLKVLQLSMSNFLLPKKIGLKEQFPNLTFVAMPKRTQFFELPSVELFNHLPPLLEMAHVPYFLKYHEIGALPRYLKHLTLAIAASEGLVPENMAEFMPRHLTKLKLYDAPNVGLFPYLPQTLTKLRLMNSGDKKVNFIFGQLTPQELADTFAQLPPGLKILGFPFASHQFTVTGLSELPSSLKELRNTGERVDVTYEAVSALPRGLETLSGSFWFDGDQRSDITLADLVSSLPKTMKSMPYQLEHLVATTELVHLLPRTLTAMAIYVGLNEVLDLSALPPSLTRLTMRTRGPLHVKPGGTGRFPPNLKDFVALQGLSEEAWQLFEASKLQHLKKASIGGVNGADEDDDDNDEDDTTAMSGEVAFASVSSRGIQNKGDVSAAIRCMPRTIQYLELHARFMPLEPMIPYWPSFDQLTTLKVTQAETNFCPDPISGKFIKALPKSLEELQLHGTVGCSDLELFIAFPKLQFLTLSTVSGILKDSHFVGLEKIITLRSLTICCNETCAYTAEFHKSMPPLLHTLSLPATSPTIDGRLIRWPGTMHEFKINGTDCLHEDSNDE